MVNRRPQLQLIAPSATPAQAAAIVAALERFMRDTAPPLASADRETLEPWTRAARLEGVGLHAEDSSPWDQSEPWG